MGRIAARLKELGLELPVPAVAVANYVPYVVTGSLVFVSGQLPLENGKPVVLGRLGENLSIDDGARGARLCALNLLAQAKAAAGGDLDRIRRLVRLTAFVNCTNDFTDQPCPRRRRRAVAAAGGGGGNRCRVRTHLILL